MPSASDLDAVTVDAFGTLLALEDPVDGLRAALRAQGVERRRDEVRAAFRAEAAYYRPRSLSGRDRESLAALRRDCVAIFLEHLGAGVDPDGFVPAFMESIVFRVVDGGRVALDTLRSAGISLACVANWDVSLFAHLQRLGLEDRFQTVLTSAEAGAEKPDPRIFRLALEQLGVDPSRALHIGDEDADSEGAGRAGIAFEPVPLATLPARLGL